MSCDDSHFVALAFGSDMGDTHENLRLAFERLEAAGVHLAVVSRMIQSAPVDCEPGTPDFTNCVAIGKFSGSPQELLAITQHVEIDGGRPAAHSSRQARLIDIDILLFDDVNMRTAALEIPHPRMFQRAFVMEPLAEAMEFAERAGVPLPPIWWNLGQDAK